MRNGDYILVIAPPEYQGKKYRERYCYEHHLVWWQNTGEVLKEGELVHHKDENKHHNVFSNLEKKTISSHNVGHNLGKKKDQDILRNCPMCEKDFYITARNFKSKSKVYGSTWKPCCSRSCQVRKQQKELKSVHG